MSVANYFSKVKNLADTLAAIGRPLEDEEIITYMLVGLDSKFEPLITSVTTRIDPFSLNDLFAHLLSYEMCMEHHNTSLQVSSFSANNVSCPSQRGKYMGREEVVAKVGIK